MQEPKDRQTHNASSDTDSPFGKAIAQMADVGMKPGMEVIFELLRQLGNPHEKYAVIHVAGTNGKGSVCAMLAHALREAGISTGLYTSPHMMYYNERFLLNGEMISDDSLFAILMDVERAVDETERQLGQRPKEFEILTAMAFLWFFREGVEVLILETGMGGRFDATNVVAKPLLTVITNVALDHEAYLGDTIAKIAWEKAGIIKAGTALITACDDRDALDVIDQEFMTVQANEPATPLMCVLDECQWETQSLGLSGQEVNLVTPGHTYPQLYIPLPGKYQCANLACVVLAWEFLATQEALAAEDRMTTEALRKGLASVGWPCRLEQVQESPTVVLDGSHNPDGIRQMALWLTTHQGRYDKTILVMGMLEDKDRLAAAGQLDGLAAHVIITKPISDRAGRWQDLAGALANTPSENIEFIENCHEAVKTAIDMAGEKDLVLCTGSLYLVGELRKNWKGKALFSR